MNMRFHLLLIAVLVGHAIHAAADTAADLPAPDQPTQQLHLPDGFKATIYAHSEEIDGARMMAFGPDGNLYVSDSRAGKVLMLPDRNRDGRPTRACWWRTVSTRRTASCSSTAIC